MEKKKHPQAIVVGTSHVSQQSLDNIKKAIDNFKPDVVCVELDEKRYEALKSGRTIRIQDAIKNKAMFLYAFSTMQQYIGKKTGHKPGVDMLFAVKYAKEKKIPVALVDRDIANISYDIKRVPKSEKAKLILALVGGLLFSRKKEDLHNIPSEKLIDQAMKEIKKISPRFYKLLVVDRNIYMTEMVNEVIKDKNAKKVVVVVGAGHRREIASLLNKKKIRSKMA